MEAAETKTKKAAGRWRAVAAAVVTLLLIAAAVLVFVYRDALSAQGLRRLFGRETTAELGDAYVYESGSAQAFATGGNCLAVASSTGLQLLSDEGYTVARQVFSMASPACAASDSLFAFYDIGGTALRVADRQGEIHDLSTGAAVISLSMNASGYLAVVTEESGYKGLVTVYDPSLTPIYQWYSGTGYALTAEVSPDNRSLAVVCAGADGGTVRLLSLGSETEKGSFTAAGELFLQAHWFTGDRLCVLGETRVLFLSGDGRERASYDFEGLYLTDYSLESTDFIALYLSRYRSGTAGVLVTLDQNGGELGRLELQTDLQSLSAYGDRLAALCGDGVTLYGRNLAEQGTYDQTLGVKKALLRKKGDVLLLSSYYAERVSFR